MFRSVRRPTQMHCTCGKENGVHARDRNMCIDGLIRIDDPFPSTVQRRVRGADTCGAGERRRCASRGGSKLFSMSPCVFAARRHPTVDEEHDCAPQDEITARVSRWVVLQVCRRRVVGCRLQDDSGNAPKNRVAMRRHTGGAHILHVAPHCQCEIQKCFPRPQSSQRCGRRCLALLGVLLVGHRGLRDGHPHVSGGTDQGRRATCRPSAAPR